MKSDPNPTTIAQSVASKMPKLQPNPAKDAVAAANTYKIDIPEKSESVNERELNRMTRAAQLTTMYIASNADVTILLKLSRYQKLIELIKKLLAPSGALDLSAIDHSSVKRQSLSISL